MLCERKHLQFQVCHILLLPGNNLLYGLYRARIFCSVVQFSTYGWFFFWKTGQRRDWYGPFRISIIQEISVEEWQWVEVVPVKKDFPVIGNWSDLFRILNVGRFCRYQQWSMAILLKSSTPIGVVCFVHFRKRGTDRSFGWVLGVKKQKAGKPYSTESIQYYGAERVGIWKPLRLTEGWEKWESNAY